MLLRLLAHRCCQSDKRPTDYICVICLITLLMILLDPTALKCKEKCLLWKPYANESKDSKCESPTNIWSSYTPATKCRETAETTDKSKSSAIPADAVKHVSERQIPLQNIKLPPPKSPSEQQESDTKHQCNRCQRTYTSNGALVKHQRYYCNFYQSKSFTCKYCDKVYMSLGALKMHIRTHTLPCTCMICGKAFSRPWLLQGHIRTHTGEKPYECSYCNRAFADRSNLRAHLQTHAQVKKYKCEQCAKTFSRMSLLIKHQNNCTCAV